MAFIDYYKIMGISKDTPQKDIRLAYKKRAKSFHPDLHPDDPKAKAKFQALNEAYDVLNDPEKRAKYDQYGEHWKEAGMFGGAGGAGGGDGFENFDFGQFQQGGGGGFSSFFQDLFGGGGFDFSGARSRQGRRQVQTPDREVSINIDMYTALLGGEILVQVSGGQKIKLKVKPETTEGTKVRLRGKGNQRPDGTFTDMILTYHVTLPTQLTERQKELLREMRDAS